VALADHFSIDVSIADPDMTHRPAIAINGHNAHLDLFAENLVGERLLRPRGSRLAALGCVDLGQANPDGALCYENGDRVAVCDANDLAHEGLGFGGEWEKQKK
jgi:hypothetical protein